MYSYVTSMDAGFLPIVWRYCLSLALLDSGPVSRVRGILSIAGKTRWVAETYVHSNRSCRLAPAHQVMKSRSCGLVQRIGAADSATPHPDPSGGQAHLLQLIRLWVCASGILASILRSFPADMGPVESPIQLISQSRPHRHQNSVGLGRAWPAKWS